MILSAQIFEQVDNKIPGWLLKEKLYWFVRAYKEMAPVNNVLDDFFSVEIGAFYGLSAIAQGLIIKALNFDCKLLAVDAWSKAACVEGSNSEANSEWWSKLDHSKAYHSFCDSVKTYGLEGIVFPVVGKSEDVRNEIPQQINLMHQDGNHSYEVVSREIELYAVRMAKGGYWIADDYAWPEMAGATNKLLDYGFELIHEHNKDGQSFAVYKKK